jgi:hypothetical protein
VNAPEPDQVAEVVEVEEPDAALDIQPPAEPAPPAEPGNPDGWLQWALIIGLLVLFLICALLILIGWNNR